MKAASLHELKKELSSMPPATLTEHLLRIAKFKKENKELLTYLLFEAGDEEGYIESIKKEIDEQFTGINRTNMHYSKKGLRKALRIANKFIKYSGVPTTELALRIYYLQKVNRSGIKIDRYTVLVNLYNQQLKKIDTTMKKLHEDLQYDYHDDVEKLKYIWS